jgi:hypothetical protein
MKIIPTIIPDLLTAITSIYFVIGLMTILIHPATE